MFSLHENACPAGLATVGRKVRELLPLVALSDCPPCRLTAMEIEMTDKTDAVTGHTPPSQGGGKGRGGRPSKSDADLMKNVPLRMTAGERQQAEEAATAAGLTLSAYLRSRTLGKAVKGIVPAVNRQAYAELSRSTSNLNQIAAHLNSGNHVDLESLRRLLTSTADEVRRLRLALLGIEENGQ